MCVRDGCVCVLGKVKRSMWKCDVVQRGYYERFHISGCLCKARTIFKNSILPNIEALVVCKRERERDSTTICVSESCLI